MITVYIVTMNDATVFCNWCCLSEDSNEYPSAGWDADGTDRRRQLSPGDEKEDDSWGEQDWWDVPGGNEDSPAQDSVSDEDILPGDNEIAEENNKPADDEVDEASVPVDKDEENIQEGADGDSVLEGEDKVPESEDAVPNGEDSVPEGEDNVPEGEENVPDLGEEDGELWGLDAHKDLWGVPEDVDFYLPVEETRTEEEHLPENSDEVVYSTTQDGVTDEGILTSENENEDNVPDEEDEEEETDPVTEDVDVQTTKGTTESIGPSSTVSPSTTENPSSSPSISSSQLSTETSTQPVELRTTRPYPTSSVSRPSTPTPEPNYVLLRV